MTASNPHPPRPLLQVLDLTQDSDIEEGPALADVAAWLEANGGCGERCWVGGC